MLGPSLTAGVKEGGSKLILLLRELAEGGESAFLSPLPASAQVPAVLLHPPLSVLHITGQQSCRTALMCGDESLPRSSQSGGRSPPLVCAPWRDSSPLRMQHAPTPAGGRSLKAIHQPSRARNTWFERAS